MATEGFRVEKDSMGEVKVPEKAYYGAQTQRAVENFPISGVRFPRRFIRAMGLIKGAAAEANLALGRLDEKRAKAIIQAAGEVAEGKLDDQFPLDVFQTGSGTSTNMNANEVIANRAIEILGGARGDKKVLHPNDHVNFGQSSNDVIPTAIHVAAVDAYEADLKPAIAALKERLVGKARAWDGIIKIGRTHLMDAMPVRLGQEFSGYATQVREGEKRIIAAVEGLYALAIGGTAVGTGANTDPKFPGLVVEKLKARTKYPFREADNKFEALGARDAVVFASGANKSLAAALIKIANDIRWMGSGPACGLGEMLLPETQPGSSIMPGKVNPVMCEALIMVSAQVIGHDQAITLGGLYGNFELNVMMPVMVRSLLEQVTFLAGAIRAFDEKCLAGLEPNRERIEGYVEKSLALATALAPSIGYDKAAEIAKKVKTTGKTVRQLATEMKLLPPDKLAEILDVRRMTEPGISGVAIG